MKPLVTAVLAFVGAAAATPLGAQTIEVLPVQGFNTTKVYMIAGAGGNITAQIGDEGVLLVDTGTAAASEKVLAAIRQLTDKPIKYIINTHAHPDHVGGNEAIVKASGGQRSAQGGGGGGVQNPNGVIVVAHQNTANRMNELATGGQPAYSDAVPGDTFLTETKTMYFNGEGIELYWHPSAHSDGDVMVFFRRSDVVSAGDLLHTETFSVIDAKSGGGVQGLLDGLNHIVELAIPRFNQQDGTLIVPGHGRISNQSDVVDVRDMTTIIRDRIQHMIQKKMTLEQVKAARPTVDYNPVYGTTTGPWTTDIFIETMYRDLSQPRKGPLPKSGLNFSDGGQ